MVETVILTNYILAVVLLSKRLREGINFASKFIGGPKECSVDQTEQSMDRSSARDEAIDRPLLLLLCSLAFFKSFLRRAIKL